MNDQRWLLAIVLPPVAGAVFWLGVLGMSAATGVHPIWRLAPRNVAEAAALRDASAAVRRVEHGESVNTPGEVRRRVILDDAAVVSPIEAAAGGRDETIVQLIFDLGATPDAATWHRAFCISDEESVRAVLKSHQPPGASEMCADD